MNQFFVAFLFFLFDRYLSEIYFIKHVAILNSAYTLTSKVATVLVIGWFLARVFRRHYRVGLTGGALLAFILLGLSTLIESGDLRRWLMAFYPFLAQSVLVVLCCQTSKSIAKFVHTLSTMYLGLALINLGFMCLSMDFFSSMALGGSVFFLGIENQIGYALMMGLLFTAMDYYYNPKMRKRFLLYLGVQGITLLMIFSGSNIVGFTIAAAAVFVPVVHRFFVRVPFSLVLTFYLAFFLVFAVFQDTSLLETPILRYIIVDLLGKNTTLTNRTYIWELVMKGVHESPLWGHGVRETGDLFHISIYYTNRPSIDENFSAHNQMLQSLYEGGVMFVATIFACLYACIRYLRRMPMKKISVLMKIVLLSILIMYMGEAPGINIMLFFVVFISLVCQVEYAEARSKELVAYAPSNLRHRSRL